MSLPLVFHPDVQADTDEAYRWYEQQRAGLGDDFLAELDIVFRRLEQMPGMFQVIWQNVRRALPRRFPYGVYYRIEQDRVEVLAVHHTRRDPTSWQGRN